MLKKIIAVIAGFIWCVVLNAVFVQFEIRFTETEKIANPYYTQQIMNGTADFDPMEITQRFVWRQEFIYIPLNILLTTLIVALIDRKTPYITSLLACSPFLLIQLMTGGDSLFGLTLFTVYVAISLAFGYLFSRVFRQKKFSDRPPTIEESLTTVI